MARTGSLLCAVGLLACVDPDDPCADAYELDPPPEPDGDGPPTVVDGRWLEPGVLELRFSEALDPGVPPDPARFAVVSWAARSEPHVKVGVSICYVETSYDELSRQPDPSGYEPGPHSLTEVVVDGQDPTLLRVTLAEPGASCPTIPNSIAEGVILAYAAGGFGEELLLAADGSPVPNLGPAWAIENLEQESPVGATIDGHLNALDALAPIPCPE